MYRMQIQRQFRKFSIRFRLNGRVWKQGLQRQLKRNFANDTSQSSGSRSAARWLFYSLGLGTASTGGALSYAYYDPKFREKIQTTLPASQPVLERVLGAPRDLTQKISLPGAEKLGEIKEKLKEYLPKKKEQKSLEETPKEAEGLPETPVIPPPQQSSTPDSGKAKDAELMKKMDIEDVHKRKANFELERKIREFITNAEMEVKATLDRKRETVAAVLHHCQLLKLAVEDPQDPNWQSASSAMEAMKMAEQKDSNQEEGARGVLGRLRSAVNEGRSQKATGDNPLLINAQETLNALLFQLAEASAQVESARTESRIMTDFKELIDRSREQFAAELKSILPHVEDIHAKNAKLNEDELNSLIAHAHLKVDQLRKQLTEQQLREQQHIEAALERQKAEGKKELEIRVERELNLAQSQQEAELLRQKAELSENFEDELKAQLRRAAAAHSEHLEDVLRVQKEQKEVETIRRVDESIQRERDLFHREVSSAMARLEGIEKALESRAVLDAENRRGKEIWLAAQNLQESVIHGRKAGYDPETRRKPIGKEVEKIREAASGDTFLNTLIHAVPEKALHLGVYTEEDIKSRFLKLRKLCRRTALIGDDGGSLWQYFVSLLQSMFIFDIGKEYAKQDQVDVSALDTYDILSRASYFIFEKEDYETAIRLMQLLRGAAGRQSQDWLEDVRLHLETRQVVDVMVAHCAALSLETVY